MPQKLIHIFLNFFFPQKCIWCEKEGEILCKSCLTKIDWPSLPQEGNIYSATDYQDAIVKKALWALKYRKIKALAEPLADLIQERVWSKLPLKNTVVIPVPLSEKRLRERGFNQAELIARHLAPQVITNVLYKKFHTETQVAVKNRQKRLGNLKGSFGIKNPELIRGKNIILIDDVCTTGATITEACKVLRQAGAKKIIAVVVARG